MVDKLCLLAQSSCLSGLLLGATSIGPVICFPFSFVQKKGFVFEKKERLCFPFVVSVCSLYTSNMSSHLVLLFMQVETIRLTEALSCTSQELLRLELSNCGLTTPDFTQICTNLSRINILELNLGGNPINLEV